MNQPRTFRELAQLALDRHGVSARRLAALAQEHGFELTYSTLSAVAAGKYKSRPRSETVRAIAWLAGVPESTAFVAAGLPIPGRPFADELPPDADSLSPEQRRVVIEVMRQFTKHNRELDDIRRQHVTPMERYDVALAAMPGTPEHMPDGTTGEESQDPGSDEPV